MTKEQPINPEFPLVPGEWDIDFEDLETKLRCTMRYVLIKTTLVKELEREGMEIIKVRQMR